MARPCGARDFDGYACQRESHTEGLHRRFDPVEGEIEWCPCGGHDGSHLDRGCIGGELTAEELGRAIVAAADPPPRPWCDVERDDDEGGAP